MSRLRESTIRCIIAAENRNSTTIFLNGANVVGKSDKEYFQLYTNTPRLRYSPIYNFMIMQKFTAVCLLFGFLLMASTLNAQRNTFSLSADYGIYNYTPLINDFILDGAGFTISYERAIRNRFAAGLGVQYLFCGENNLISYTDLIGNPIEMNHTFSLIKPYAKWYPFANERSKPYIGAAANWNYLTIISPDAKEGSAFGDPSDLFGGGFGAFLGYRHEFANGLGVFVQGNADWLWFDIGSGNKSQELFGASLGITKSF
jgi:hypothetical protein